MVVLVPNIRPKGVLFPVGAGRSVRRAHVIQKVRPGPPRPPGETLRALASAQTHIQTTIFLRRQTVHSTLSSWLHSCTSDYANDAVITSAGGDPATVPPSKLLAPQQ